MKKIVLLFLIWGISYSQNPTNFPYGIKTKTVLDDTDSLILTKDATSTVVGHVLKSSLNPFDVNQKDAIISSANPSGVNPFATILDLTNFGLGLTLQAVTTNGNTTDLPLIVQGATIKSNLDSKSLSIGNDALLNDTGGANTAIGNASLQQNTTGSANTAIGNGSLQQNTTGGANTAIGDASLYSNTTGGANTAIGNASLQQNTTGGANTAIGNASLQQNTTGGANTAIGNASLAFNDTGDANTAIGASSLFYNTTGGNNTAIGDASLQQNTTGNNNLAIGISAGGLQTIQNQTINLNASISSSSATQDNQFVINTNGANIRHNTNVATDLLFDYPLTSGRFALESQLSGATVDATTTVKGIVKLAGDLDGTADLPTVPNMLNKVNNLADLNNIVTARTNLGLGTLATSNDTIPTNTNQLTNGSGFITGITSVNVTTALGYTPYNATNPNGYISSYTETDPIVRAISGIVKSNGTTISSAIANTDYALPNAVNTTYANDYRASNFIAGTNYVSPTGSGASLTGITATQVGAVASNALITGATNTKITYDAKGLVTAGTTLSSTDIPNLAQSQITNLITDLSSKQSNITLTTTGTSGASTFIGNVLNVPNYATVGGGATWGTITGVLSTQTDLQNELNLKANLVSPTFTMPRLNNTSTTGQAWIATDNIGNGSFQTITVGGDAIKTNGLQQFSNTTEATLNVLSATPTTPTAGTSKFYIKEIGGRPTFITLDQFGETNQMQTALSFNNYSCVNYGLGAVPNVFGRAMTFLATVTHPSILATNLKTSINRYTHTSTATAGVVTGTRVTTVECLRGNAPKIGGFYVVSRFSLTTLQVGNRAFVGVSTAGATAPTNIDPTTSTTAAVIGMAINANTGNWNLVHNSVGVAPTVIALGTNFPVNNTDFLELIIYAPPNNANVYYRVKNLNTDNTTSGVISTNLPLNTAILGRTAWMTNNATAAAVAFDISKFSCETPY